MSRRGWVVDVLAEPGEWVRADLYLGGGVPSFGVPRRSAYQLQEIYRHMFPELITRLRLASCAS